jgi:endonuclease YncB( thermonuclease family)
LLLENNESLSRYIVKNGYAFAYRRYSDQFVQDEEYAKSNQLGLWKMKFDFPWDYRKKN